ncbi:MAG: quinone oxidoreductase family protein, partial [Methylococcales bacterium]
VYPVRLPMTPGIEGAGTIDAIGSKVENFSAGDRVAWVGYAGTYAEYAEVPASKLVPIPDAMSTQQAGAALLQGMTAHYLSHDTFPVRAGHTVLVHAAASGTGSLLVQFAKLRGATVIGTVSTETKAERARNLGADHVINYRETDFEVEIRSITHGSGVDAVYDSVGKNTFEKSLKCLKYRGILVLFGQSSGSVPAIEPSRLGERSLFLTRPSLVHYTQAREELLRRARFVFDAIIKKQISLNIDRIFPLSAASDAHRYLEAGKTKGKVLLTP